MKTFSVYLEDRTMALIPKAGTLEDFLRSLEGRTIKQILDDSSYMNLYMGNKYGIGGQREGSDRDATDFANKLVRFVNRDIKKMRPEIREYETPEFKEEHDYDSYQRARSKKARLGMDRLKARREDASEEEMGEIQDKIDKYEDVISNHPYQRGMSMIEREYDKAVQNYHNSPLTGEFLRDDGSELYDDLVAAFSKLGGQSETVIDV
jgi:hypothetical protein|tara:strand:+ start:32 stop:652 length:621 start_codon:yes stop_codon:yes gene_type:complete